jgi:hypothetical protein
MLEHLEHQLLGAAGLAPDAKPARNNILLLLNLSVYIPNLYVLIEVQR